MQYVCTQCSHLPLLRNQNPSLEREPGSWSPTLTPISERRGVHGQGRELPLRGRRQTVREARAPRVTVCVKLLVTGAVQSTGDPPAKWGKKPKTKTHHPA